MTNEIPEGATMGEDDIGADACYCTGCGCPETTPIPETMVTCCPDRNMQSHRSLALENAELAGDLRAALARASELGKDLEYYKFLHGNQAATIQKAWDALAAAEAQAEAARMVVFIARTINHGPYEDERMTGVLKAYDAITAPAPGGSSGEAG